jgi:hypothetical protein
MPTTEELLKELLEVEKENLKMNKAIYTSTEQVRMLLEQANAKPQVAPQTTSAPAQQKKSNWSKEDKEYRLSLHAEAKGYASEKGYIKEDGVPAEKWDEFKKYKIVWTKPDMKGYMVTKKEYIEKD